jgi:serine/threonine protein kinase
MDFYEGETLKSKIERGPTSIDETVEIALQMARGLAKAHEHGIVHRDIKPANVIVTRDGLVKIVDFGLAKLTGLTMLTKVGSTIGTPAYMSPEQARGEDVDQRTDEWSLGVVLFEMLTGRLPFRGEHESAII